MAGEMLFKPRNGRTVRLTRLVGDCCELPAEETVDSIIVLDVFTVVSATPNYQDGATAFETKANGDICTNERDPSILQDISIALTLCQVSASTVSMLTGSPAVFDASGNVVGFDIMEGALSGRTALETFSGLSGAACNGGNGYSLFPCTYDWQFSAELNIAAPLDTLFDVQLTGRTNGNHAWDNGPYAVQLDSGGDAGPLLDSVQTGVHGRVMVTDVGAPAVTDGWVTASAENGYLFGPDSI